MSPHPRNAGLDVVRVVGIVAVVAGHVFHGEAMRSAIYTWHVPLFFFLSGYLWKRFDAAGRPRTVWSEWQTRSATLLRPYVMWLVLISSAFLPWSFLRGDNTPFDALRPLLGGSYVGLPFSAFWFITALVGATLLLRALDRSPPWVAWAIAGVGITLATAVPALLSAIPLSFGIAVPALVFVLLGRTFRRIVTTVTRPVLTALALAGGAGLAIALGSRPLDLKTADLGTPVISTLVAAALSAAFVLAGSALGRQLSPRLAQSATTLATCGIGVILTHSAVIWLAGSAIDQPWLVFALAATLPWLLMLALRRTRLAPLLLGVPRLSAMPARTRKTVRSADAVV